MDGQGQTIPSTAKISSVEKPDYTGQRVTKSLKCQAGALGLMNEGIFFLILYYGRFLMVIKYKFWFYLLVY